MRVTRQCGVAGQALVGVGLLCVLSPGVSAQVRSTDEIYPELSSVQEPTPQAQLRPSIGIDDIRNVDNTLWVAVGAAQIDYAETSKGIGNVDSEYGALPALSGGVSYLDPYSNMYMALDADGAWGDLRYHGGNLFTGAPIVGETNESIWSVHYRAGYAFPVGARTMLIPLAQIGYRQWERELSAVQSESYHNWTATAGLLAQYAPVKKLVLSLRAEIGESFAGGMKSKAEGLPTLSFDLGSKLTYNAEAKASYAISARFQLFARFDYDRLDYGMSQLRPIGGGLGLFEPDSRTHSYMTQLGAAYRFQ